VKARRFEVRRHDMDGHKDAVEIEAEDLLAVTGRTFDEANRALITELEALLAEARALEEPTP
jgi:hypothetical protein